MSMSDVAMAFYDACETGKGWGVCSAWCHEGATFSCQADSLAESPVKCVKGFAALICPFTLSPQLPVLAAALRSSFPPVPPTTRH